MELDSDWLGSLLEKKEANRRLGKIVSSKTEDAAEKGSNYMSVIQRVTVDVTWRSGVTSTRALIVKWAPKNHDDHMRFSQTHKMFDIEIQVYTDVLKNMEDLVVRSGKREETLWCEFIGCKPDVLVLEDLRVRGFANVDRRAMLDMELCSHCVTSLAKFHANSIALKKTGFNFDNFDYYMFCSPALIRRQMKGVLRTFSEAMTSWGKEWEGVANRVRQLPDVFERKITALARFDETKLNVLNHGDCWTANILFKFRDDQFDALKFIDFQCSHYNSFAWDLTFLMYSSVIPGERRKHYTDILRIYLTSLKQSLADHGFDLPPGFDLQEVEKEMKRLRLFAFMMLSIMLPLTTSNVEQGLDPDDYFSTDESKEPGGISADIYTDSRFKNHVAEDLRQFMDEGVI